MDYSYSKQYRPPAPVLELSVLHPQNPNNLTQVTGKIDTGADITTIPETLLLHLGIPPCREVIAIGFDDVETRRRTYLVNLSIAGVTHPFQEVMATSGNQVLIGRDLLNQWIMTLDGPNAHLDISFP